MAFGQLRRPKEALGCREHLLRLESPGRGGGKVQLSTTHLVAGLIWTRSGAG